MDGIDGLPNLLARLQKMEQRLDPSGLNQPLTRAGLVALKAAADRIDVEGPGWPARKRYYSTPMLHRTGRLLRSLTANASGNVFDVQGSTVEVGTNVRYARYLQTGTSRMPPRPYLFIDEAVAERVRAIFAKYVMTGDTNAGNV